MTNEQMRPEFEALAISKGHGVTRDGDLYRSDFLPFAWECYQAATRAEQGKRQPLTDEQIEKCVEQVWGSFADFDEVRLFTRAIEAAHGITATPQGNP